MKTKSLLVTCITVAISLSGSWVFAEQPQDPPQTTTCTLTKNGANPAQFFTCTGFDKQQFLNVGTGAPGTYQFNEAMGTEGQVVMYSYTAGASNILIWGVNNISPAINQGNWQRQPAGGEAYYTCTGLASGCPYLVQTTK